MLRRVTPTAARLAAAAPSVRAALIAGGDLGEFFGRVAALEAAAVVEQGRLPVSVAVLDSGERQHKVGDPAVQIERLGAPAHSQPVKKRCSASFQSGIEQGSLVFGWDRLGLVFEVRHQNVSPSATCGW